MNSAAAPRSLAEIRALMQTLPAPDAAAAAQAQARQARLLKPPGSLGRLEELAVWLAGWQGCARPQVLRPLVAVFAGNHGVTAQGVSAWPAAITRHMTASFTAGEAAINQIASVAGADLKVWSLDLDTPTADMTQAPAMTAGECVRHFAWGMTAASGHADLLCIGEMGIGNTTSAAVLSCALFGGGPAAWVGPGAGADAAILARKLRAAQRALKRHGAALDDPLQALRRVGGRELAAMAGAIAGARLRRLPILLDGYVATAAAAVLHRLHPAALDHCQSGHLSAEPAHARLLEHLGKKPLLDLGMRLGEGSGAALAIAIIRAAAKTHTNMAMLPGGG